MSEHSLEDVELEHFQSFLEDIHQEPALNDDTIQQVLQLCKKYRARHITRQCEEFLIYKSRFSNKKKLQLVVLMDLKQNIMNNLKSATEVRAALDPDMKNPVILKELLEKALALHVNSDVFYFLLSLD